MLPLCCNQRLRIRRYRLPIFSFARPVRTPRSCKSLISAFRAGSVTETVRRPLQTVTEPSGTLILVFSAASIRLINSCSAAESSARIESRCFLIAAIFRTEAEMSVVLFMAKELNKVSIVVGSGDCGWCLCRFVSCPSDGQSGSDNSEYHP